MQGMDFGWKLKFLLTELMTKEDSTGNAYQEKQSCVGGHGTIT